MNFDVPPYLSYKCENKTVTINVVFQFQDGDSLH